MRRKDVETCFWADSGEFARQLDQSILAGILRITRCVELGITAVPNKMRGNSLGVGVMANEGLRTGIHDQQTLEDVLYDERMSISW